MLPLLGPSTLRDSTDIASRWFTNPLQLVSMNLAYELMITGVQVTDARTRADWAIRFRDKAAINPCVFTRETYMRHRVSLLNPDRPDQADEDFHDIPATQPAGSSLIVDRP